MKKETHKLYWNEWTNNKNMNIYTFYEPVDPLNVNDEHLLIIDLWKKSWAFNGWSPIVLSLSDAKKHPEYQNFYDICYKFPTVNNKTYEMYCYLRWLAMDLTGGWHTDYDVINYSFKPIDYGDKIVSCIECGSLSPSTVYLPKHKYKHIIDCIKNYVVSDNDVYIHETGKKSNHVSDMTIINNTLKNTLTDITLNVQKDINYHDDWENSPLIHYSQFHCPGKKKSTMILQHQVS